MDRGAGGGERDRLRDILLLRPDVEVRMIVVLDSCSDGSAAIAARYAAAKHILVSRVGLERGPVEEALDAATRLVREHGTISILGFHQGGDRSVDLETWNWKSIWAPML